MGLARQDQKKNFSGEIFLSGYVDFEIYQIRPTSNTY